MTPRQRAAHRDRLLHHRAEVTAAGPARIEPNRSDPATIGVADEDAQALSEMMQVLASTRNRERAQLVARIDRALARLEASPADFGLCEDCEAEIPYARLDANPTATRCVACQMQHERGAASAPRL